MKKFTCQFIDNERREFTGDQYAMSESLKIYKEVRLSDVIETAAKPRELVAVVSLAQLKWLEIVEDV